MPPKKDESETKICHLCSTPHEVKKDEFRKCKSLKIRNCSTCNKLCCYENYEVSTPKHPTKGCYLTDCHICNKKDVCENCRITDIACCTKCHLEC